MIAYTSTADALLAPSHPRLTTDITSGGVECIDPIADEWRALCEGADFDAPFHRPEVIRAYLDAYAGDSRLSLISVRQHGRLVGVLPLITEHGFCAGLPARQRRSAGNVHTCRFDLVHAPGLAADVLAAVWDALKHGLRWDVLQFDAVPAGGALAHLPRLARTDGFAAHARRGTTSPYVVLPAAEDAFEHVLRRLDGKFRANLRRRMRKLESRGAVRLVRSTAADASLHRFYAMERSGWKGSERTAIAQDPKAERFYDALAATAEQFGYLTMYSLECENQCVAMQFGLTYRQRYYVLKTAYDESLRDCSPGQLITMEVLRDLAQRGCVELDFLGISMEWKRDWCPRLRPHADWTIYRGPYGALLHLFDARARRALRRGVRRWTAATAGSTESSTN